VRVGRHARTSEGNACPRLPPTAFPFADVLLTGERALRSSRASWCGFITAALSAWSVGSQNDLLRARAVGLAEAWAWRPAHCPGSVYHPQPRSQLGAAPTAARASLSRWHQGRSAWVGEQSPGQ
jgi:hypothetical protein